MRIAQYCYSIRTGESIHAQNLIIIKTLFDIATDPIQTISF